MSLIEDYKLKKTDEKNDEYELIIYSSAYNEEMSDELGRTNECEDQVMDEAKELIDDKYSNLKITMIKIFAGSLLVASIPLTAPPGVAKAQNPHNQVSIPTKVGEPIPFNPDQMVAQTNRVSPRIILNGRAVQSPAVIQNGTTYVSIRAISEALGARVTWDSATRSVRIVQNNTTIHFRVGTTTATVNDRVVNTPGSYITNGTTMVPLRFISETLGLKVDWDGVTKSVTLTSPASTATPRLATEVEADVTPPAAETVPTATEVNYRVVAGDSLWSLANRFHTTIEAIKTANQLRNDTLYIGQQLIIPRAQGSAPTAVAESPNPTAATPPQTNNEGVTITYINHTIVSGDNMWSLSQRYGIPLNDLLKANNMTQNSRLSIGQTIVVPVYHVPVKPVVSPNHGELLDWWTEARYVYSTGKVATITDVQSGRTFQVKHTMGGNHADSEPLTARDAQIMKEVWGGSYSWTPRAVIVEVDGRRLAAAMHSFPHGDHVIRDNNYNGHFCIHFLNSTRHKDGLIQDSMQDQIRLAAGVAK